MGTPACDISQQKYLIELRSRSSAWLEQLTHNQLVAGPNPAGTTMKLKEWIVEHTSDGGDGNWVVYKIDVAEESITEIPSPATSIL